MRAVSSYDQETESLEGLLSNIGSLGQSASGQDDISELRYLLIDCVSHTPLISFRESSPSVISAITRATVRAFLEGGYAEADLEVEVLEKLYEITMMWAEKTPQNIRKKSSLLFNAAKCAKMLYDATKNTEWAKKDYDARIRNAEISIVLSEIEKASYSNSFAGDSAKIVFEATKDILWAERWYEAKVTAGNLIVDFDRKNAAHNFDSSGESAKKLFKLTQGLNWAEMWYESKKISGDLFSDYDKGAASYNLSSAGDAARAIFLRTREVKWAERGYEAKLASADLRKDIQPEKSALDYECVGEIAEKLFELTRDAEWLIESNLAYGLSADIFKESGKEIKAARSYSRMGRTFMKLYYQTRDIQYAHNWHECSEISSDIGERIDKECAAISRFYAGNAATQLFERTNIREWKIAALSHYSKFERLCKGIKGEDIKGMLDSAKRSIGYIHSISRQGGINPKK